MNAVRILRLDTHEEEEFKLSALETTIGRGTVLGCYDKRISRNHGTLRLLDDDCIEIIATHTNPCFYKEKHRDLYSVLMKEETKILYIGDEFSLLPDSYKYRIAKLDQELMVKDDVEFVMPTENGINSIVTPDILTPSSSSALSVNQNMTTMNLKRTIPGWLIDSDADQSSTKIMKLESENSALIVETEGNQESNQDLSDNIPNSLSNDILPNSLISNTEAKPVALPKTSHNLSDEDTKEGYEENVVDDASDEPDLVSGSTAPNPGSSTSREACLYGKDCFRKNSQHRLDFSHPGDSDYTDTANSQDKPECQYGTSCYRKNLQHRKDFKHTKRPQRQTQIPPMTSNVYCQNCTINYSICPRCLHADEPVIDLTKPDP